MNVWVFDLEGNGLLDTITTVWCGVFKNIHTMEVRKFGPKDVQRMLDFMTDETDVLIAHNGIGYDFPVLRKLHHYVYPGKVVDTLLMSRLQEPNRRLPFNCPNKRTGPHSVAAWGYRVGRGKPDHDEWDRFSDAMLHRCSEDVEIQHLIYNALLQEGKGFNWRGAHLTTFNVFRIFQQQEEYGWLTDAEHIETCLHMLTHWIDRIGRALTPKLSLVLVIDEVNKRGERGWVRKPFMKSGQYSQSVMTWCEKNGYDPATKPVGGPFTRVSYRLVDLDSIKETKVYLLDEGWVPDKWNYNDDGGRTSPKLGHDDPFMGITSGIGRLIARRVQCKHRRSQIEGWNKRIRPDGRLPQVISGIAATGRLTHKNIVNVPGGDAFFGKWMRKIFIAKKGYKIVGTDSASCQLRMLAARMGDAAYQDTIVNGRKEDGTDVHTVNQKAAGLDTKAQAKTFIYAFLFGGGDEKIGTIVGGGKAAGAKLKTQFLRKIPALKALLESLLEEWRGNAKRRKGRWGTEYYDGWIVGLDGRPIKIPSEHMVLVYMLQSDEAIMMQVALSFFDKWVTTRGYVHGVEYGYVANVHDEFQVEVREDLADLFGKLAAKAIVVAAELLKINCPHAGEYDVGNNWYETH